MIEKVIIRPKGFYRLDWDGEQRRDVISKINEDHEVLRYLRYPVEIDESLSLKDIMLLVRNNELLETFLGHYSDCDIKAFHAVLDKPPIIDENDAVHYLIVKWTTADIEEFDGETFFGMGAEFLGMGVNGGTGYQDEDNLGTYSMSCTPIEKMGHLVVKTDELLQIRHITSQKEQVPGRKRPKYTFKTKDIIELEHSFTLLDFLDAIYWDISFYGDPAARQEFVDELEAIKETEEFHNLDDILDELHDEDWDSLPPLELDDDE